MIIRDLVDVGSQPTVVRLDHLQDANSAWIRDSYYITAEVGNHFKTLAYLLAGEHGQGVFLIGHYGSGKSHFLAYLTQAVTAGKMGNGATEVLPVSLLNFSADKSLEAIIAHALGFGEETDRRAQWAGVMARHPGGLLLVLDELSEFLRSKPDMRAFNEDIRYLQFMGEWAADHKLWLVAALQEKIEHTGEMEYDLFRKIKDRYPMRLILSPAHVKDLIGERILRKAEGYAPAVEKLAGQLKRAFPDNPMDYSLFQAVYPLHPATLDLLEEVRDRFSQARGIVGFTLTRLGGDPARDVPPFLDEPWGGLLSPDVIVDHFRDLFEVQPEFLPLAQKVLPYYRKNMPRLFEKEAQRNLAVRLLKLLLLVHLSPEREALSVREAAWWLLYKVSTIDPRKNETVIARILETFRTEGMYVKKKGDAYTLDLEDTQRESLDNLITRTALALEAEGQTLLEGLIPLLSGNDFNPFDLDRDRIRKHTVTWFFHERTLQVYFGGGAPAFKEGPCLQIGLPWGPPPEARNAYRLLPAQIDVRSELVETAALLQLRERPLNKSMLDQIEGRIQTRRGLFAANVRAAYQQARLFDERGEELRGAPVAPEGGLQPWIQRLAEWLFRRTWPRFEQFAPTHGPLPRDVYRKLMAYATAHDLEAVDAPDFVRTVREAYLVPMKLMERRGRKYQAASRLDTHELVTAIKPMLSQKTSPKRYYTHLATPVYGLVPDQVHLLLLYLNVVGELEILKGRNSYRDLYETFPTPDAYDLIVPGKGLGLQQLQDLTHLCTGLEVPPPKEGNVLAQRRCATALQRLGRKRRDELSTFIQRLEAGDLGDLHEKVARHIGHWAALEKGDNELQGVQHFMFEIGSPGRFLETHAELTTLPRKLEALLGDLRRMTHLLTHPAMAACPLESVAASVAHLGDPPDLSETDVLEDWLDAARRVYGEYKAWYGARHDRFWADLRARPIWAYRVPPAARMRRLALEAPLSTLDGARARAQASLCRGLGNLDFQPTCLCGFDGADAPPAAAVAELEAAAEEVETTLAHFFGLDEVRAKVHAWLESGVEKRPEARAYLAGELPYPPIDDTALFDSHLSGVDLFRTLPLQRVTDLLGHGVWETERLLDALQSLLRRMGPRVAFEGAAPAGTAPRTNLALWCLAQALRTGSPLPEGLSGEERAGFASGLRPEWVGPAAVAGLTDLNLGREAEDAVVRLLLDGRVPLPEADTPLIAAVRALHDGPHAADASALAALTDKLYGAHAMMQRVGAAGWLDCLARAAELELTGLPSLYDVLEASQEAQWLVIDCLGAPLVPAVTAALPELLPRWKAAPPRFALVGKTTDTAQFFSELAARGINKALVKRNAVDAVVHEAADDFDTLRRRALTELAIACKRLDDLDPGKSLLIFADHGFRLRPDGKGFGHGGASTLERLVPLFVLDPYR